MGEENVNPLAEKISHPSFSDNSVVAIFARPSAEVIEIEALIGALVKPYKQRATSDLIARS